MVALTQFLIAVMNHLLAAYMLHITWGWFVETGFGIASPGFAVFVGIRFMVGFITYLSTSEFEALNRVDAETKVLHSLMRSLVLILGFGFCALTYILFI